MIEGLESAAITIGYAPFVEGTALIYDVTDETLQGKARPFDCGLRAGRPRIYALLPVQIESIRVALDGRRIDVEFSDASGARIEAALPFRLTLEGQAGKRTVADCCTNRDGRYVRAIENGGSEVLSVTVRSLLTGREERWAGQ